jgi:hypothetical protein
MRIPMLASLALLVGCTSGPDDPANLQELPETDDFCLSAQRVVTRTDVPVELVLHEEFSAFTSSKAIIDGPDGPQIQQYNWYDDRGEIVGISCKLKSADHLNLVFGRDSAGPDGQCQDMNKAVFRLVGRRVTQPVYKKVSFNPKEDVFVAANPGSTGPAWLAPIALTSVDGDTLTVHSKGFTVDFTDPTFAERPAPFRGIHYCHFLAPEYLEALLRGEAEPGATVGATLE